MTRPLAWKVGSTAEVAAATTIVAVYVLSVVLRLPDVLNGPGMRNLEAPYHVLLTVQALSEGSFADHLGLPVVSLSGSGDQLPWGATIPNGNGDYVYTSFPPLGFLVPYAFFGMLGLAPSLPGLFLFNILLQAGVVLFLYTLALRLTRAVSANPRRSLLAAVAAVCLYTFSREALASHGVIYWRQTLYQIPVLMQLLLVQRLLAEAATSRPWFLALPATSFLAASTEWTGFVFNMAVAALLLGVGRHRQRREFVVQAVAVALATLLAGLFVLGHFVLALGLNPTLEVMSARFTARSGQGATVVDLLSGYALSFPLIGVLVAILLFIALAAGGARVDADALLIVGLSMTLVAENFLLMQHATEFTYDRLKVLLPLAISAAVALARLSGRTLSGGVAAVVLVSAINVQVHCADRDRYAGWAAVNKANADLRDDVAERVDLTCAVLTTNGSVRGYANLLFQRGIREGQGPLEGRSRDVTAACGEVHLEATPAFVDLPRFVTATIRYPSGRVEVLTSPDVVAPGRRP